MTTYYLKKAQPNLDIVVIESRFAGLGASGRNGGWLTNSITGGREQYAATHGRRLAGRFQLLMNDAVDEVVSRAAKEGINADIRRGGELKVAQIPHSWNALRCWRMRKHCGPKRRLDF
ncbi:FAD-dependent oxidoreductase [Zafaria sp. Z1313]|uniref:FAD-dependent oxidoreductase n=1 Tax=unclassified Zafaria TaxID=2828765 RepID=UPI003D302648